MMKNLRNLCVYLLVAAMMLIGASTVAAEGADAVIDDEFELVGFVAGIDGEAIVISDGASGLYTLSFTEELPRTAMDEGIIEGSAVIAGFYGGFEEQSPYSGTLLSIEAAQTLIKGTIAGIDGEAFTVQTVDSTVYTFFFDEAFTRSQMPEMAEAGTAVEVVYAGEIDQNGQLAEGGVFALRIADEA